MKTAYVLESAHVKGQFVRATAEGVKWVDFPLTASRYDSATGAALACIALDLESFTNVTPVSSAS